MQFRVVPLGAPDPSRLPARLTPLPTRIDASQVTRVRHMTLTEVEDPVTGNPVVGLLNNTCWDEPLTEQPKLGTTEVWEIANTTADTHPIHIHLVQFNLLNRQRFDTRAYLRAYNAMNGGGRLPGPIPYCPPTVDPVNPPGVATDAQVIPLVDPYLRRHPIPPGPTEAGFKDTVRVKKDTVTRFLVRFGPHDRAQHGPYGGFAFDPTTGRYVWHCHILEHEDNDMMRPYAIVN
jgi:FtsP/CotA-like multicopper oxidase with cupredoxin domain